jgi:formate hydrogenlyase subunit 3/multisubunit Na+/H+ antiporter MnhD subunit
VEAIQWDEVNESPEVFDDLYLGLRAGGALRKKRRGEPLTAEEQEMLGRWEGLSHARKAFAVGAFSVVGVPPAAGFLGKVALFKSSLAVETVSASVALVILIFLGGALSFLYCFQIYQRRYLAPKPEGKPSPVALRVLVVSLAALTLAVGILPEPLLYLSDAAATVLTGGFE